MEVAASTLPIDSLARSFSPRWFDIEIDWQSGSLSFATILSPLMQIRLTHLRWWPHFSFSLILNLILIPSPLLKSIDGKLPLALTLGSLDNQIIGTVESHFLDIARTSLHIHPVTSTSPPHSIPKDHSFINSFNLTLCPSQNDFYRTSNI